jgi:hypothetical protein
VAAFTISAAPWPVGTTVAVYPAQGWVDVTRAPSGPQVTSGVTTSGGTVSFTGLAEQARYVAWALGSGVRFGTATSGLQQLVALPDRERIKLLEDQGGGTGGGGSTGGVLDLYTVDTNEHFKVIGLSNGTVTAIPFDVQPPTVPTGLVAAVKVTSVRLDWNAVVRRRPLPDRPRRRPDRHAGDPQLPGHDRHDRQHAHLPGRDGRRVRAALRLRPRRLSVHRPGAEHRADDRDPDVAARHPDQRDGAAARQRDRHGRRDARARPLHRPRKPRPHG